MAGKEQLYEAITLVTVVLFFDFLERRQPRNPVDRKRDLALNILSICVAAAGGEMCKALILEGLKEVHATMVPYLAGVGDLPGAVKIIAGLILGDFSLYWVHRAMHRPLLWPTHTFHHSISELWWLAGSRTSLTHLFLFAIPQVFIGYTIFALSPGEAGVAFSAGVVVNVWIHTNLWLDLGPLEWVLITPNYHRIHHGARGLSNRNLGFILTVWDRMFGTYIDPRTTGKDFPLGSIPTRNRLLRMIVGL